MGRRTCPSVKGQWNFDELKFVYFRDRVPAFEAFKSGQPRLLAGEQRQGLGDRLRLRRRQARAGQAGRGCRSQRVAATCSRLPSTCAGRSSRIRACGVRSTWRSTSSGPTRTCSTTQYARVGSYFDNSELKATGLPQGRELEILKEVKGQVPPGGLHRGMEEPRQRHAAGRAQAPGRGGQAARRGRLARPKNGVLTNAAGAQLTAEFLLVQPDFERIVLPYKAALEKLGIKASVRIGRHLAVSAPARHLRLRHHRRELPAVAVARQRAARLRGSDGGRQEGSRNVIGIKNPAIDKLIDKIILAKDRDDLVAATRALDRVLLWNHYVVPQWHTPFERLAMWDMYRPPGHAAVAQQLVPAGVVV